jgi:hypothetical protein
MKTRKLLVTLALLAAAAMPDPAASADDSAWFSLGSGLNDAVRTLELAGTDLYVAGNFSDAGGDPYADKVARWDGASWHPLGTQPGSWFYAVTAVATAGANVYAADRCSIRHWDGSTWQRMASPLDCTWTFFYAIAVGERGVYVGGSFQNFEGKANADNIALWHGMHLMPDTILYSRYQAATSTREVRLVNADGTNDRGIVSGSFPRLSRSRDYIAFLREGGYPPYHQNNLYVRNLANYAETRAFTSWDYIVGYDWADGPQIIFDYACAIYRMNPDGTGLTPVITDDCYNDAPAVNPWDGSIAFHNQHIGIRVADKYGGGITHVPNTQPGDQWPGWSPDGQWISFTRGGDTATHFGGNYYKIHPDGTGLAQLTFLSNDANNRMNPAGAWSSDKAYLIAPGTVNGVIGMYAVATDGSGRMRKIPAAFGAQSDFVGSIIGNMPLEQLYLPMIAR